MGLKIGKNCLFQADILKKKEITLKTNVIYKENSSQEAKFRPYISRVPTNCNLYAYGANNPVHYIDPTGMFNFETNTIEEGDTLSKIADDYNSKNGTNVTAEDIAKANNINDPNKIYSGNSLDFSSFDSSSTKIGQSITDIASYSKAANITIGIAEILLGCSLYIGSTYAAAGIEVGSSGTASYFAGMSIVEGYASGALLVGYGISRLAGTNNHPFTEDITNTFVPHEVDIATNIDSYTKKRE
ncbi:MAG: LysM peptidoglycan-binding domain-containing protein [Spirochaetales bacterium]|nr:LysM peptidoglycan-binding domain-containing protein [Spirochaetales bacterium]